MKVFIKRVVGRQLNQTKFMPDKLPVIKPLSFIKNELSFFTDPFLGFYGAEPNFIGVPWKQQFKKRKLRNDLLQ